MNIEISENDIGKAMDQLKKKTAPGPDGIPAILLKKTKRTVAKLLILLMGQSLDKSKVR